MMLEHLEQLQEIIKALNSIDVDTPREPGMSLMLGNKLPLVNDENDLYGFVSDEVGGSWSFETATRQDKITWRDNKN